MTRSPWCAAAVLAFALLAPAGVRAQLDDDAPTVRDFESPERFAFEFRIGPYDPDMGENDAFQTFFTDDNGPLLGLELDVIAYRIPDVLYLLGGGGIGWMNFEGRTLSASGERATEETSLEIVPLNLLGVIRIDALPRQLSVPLIVTGKLGYQWARWSTESGGQDDESGWSVGLLWAVQLGLDLDTFDPSAARSMDEEWGINHSFLFFELFGFNPSDDSLDIGDELAWTAGLGFMF